MTEETARDRYRNYAYPLVAPFYKATTVSESRPDRREKCYLAVFESIVKYVATIQVCQYRAGGSKEPKIEEALQRLSRPSLGHYASLTRALLEQLSGQDWSQALEELYEESVTPDIFEQVVVLSNAVHYPTPTNARSYRHLIDVLIGYRNHVAHGAAVSAREYERRLPALVDLIGALLDRLRFLAEVRLVEVLPPVDGRAEIRVWNGDRYQTEKPDSEPRLPVGHLGLERSDASLPFVDLFPYCVVLEAEDTGEPDIYFLNRATTSKVKYLPYFSGKETVIVSKDRRFGEIQDALEGRVEADEAGLPEHMQGYLRVSEQSRKSYHQALAELGDGEIDSAIVHLEHAIENSPAFRDAVLELARLQEARGQPEAREAVLAAYLKLVPGDAETLQAGDDTTKFLRAQLPYEYFISCLVETSRQGGRRVLATFISLVTILEAAVFVLHDDRMMALTVLSMGATWGTIVWATFRIRRLLGESRPNFMAFLRSREGDDLRKLLDDLIPSVFGRFEQPKKGLKAVAKGFRDNYVRFIYTVVFAAVGTAWLFSITNYSFPELETNLSFWAFGCLLFFSLGYLLSNAVGYYRFLRDLRSRTIHFSLVQHPKLSIRYLSKLSRRLSYPFLAVSTMATFSLYFGPFIPSKEFIIGLLLFLVFVSFCYYSTIFLIRRVVIQNKVRLTSQFSVHFDAPFDDLVVRARPTDLARLKELIEMRDFLDSMDVWAERKSVLVAMSLLYIGVLLFSALGISNVMSEVVPWVAKSVEKTAAEPQPRCVIIPKKEDSDIKLRVKKVDDTVLAFWGASVEDMLGASAEERLKDQEENGHKRSDWHNSVHGAIDVEISFDPKSGQGQHLLVVIYNKAYESFLYMGGGKLSYNIDLRLQRPQLGEIPVFHTQRTLRSNEKGIFYWAYLRFFMEKCEVREKELPADSDWLWIGIEAGAQVRDADAGHLRDFLGDLSTVLDAEEGAGVGK